MTTPTVIVHINADGEQTYHLRGDAELLIVDERTPHDRVYRYTTQSALCDIGRILGDDAIGSKGDTRHPALAAKIERAAEGKPVLSLVERDA